jgi:hypothetical protein
MEPALPIRSQRTPPGPGEVIVTFGKTGTIGGMHPYGFELSEASFSWTIANTAGFSVTLARPLPLHLHVSTWPPFLARGRVDRQELFVFASGVFLGFKNLSAAVEENFAFPLPEYVPAPGGLLHVAFVIPTAIHSPKSLGIGPDTRKLGVPLTAVSITKEWIG